MFQFDKWGCYDVGGLRTKRGLSGYVDEEPLMFDYDEPPPGSAAGWMDGSRPVSKEEGDEAGPIAAPWMVGRLLKEHVSRVYSVSCSSLAVENEGRRRLREESFLPASPVLGLYTYLAPPLKSGSPPECGAVAIAVRAKNLPESASQYPSLLQAPNHIVPSTTADHKQGVA
ncbi:hypothetical protein CIHG_04999 [Coccidioides immitis H538.4]|uniref:Uncharacterized protein n=1 Tax=Coccidioides immitis H538.4 TaxID=396776 RepID=A0A0J8UI02_COCIT|nr:hypothetical protein CIHG_04999 [Coccidioides immitis H538.4]